MLADNPTSPSVVFVVGSNFINVGVCGFADVFKTYRQAIGLSKSRIYDPNVEGRNIIGNYYYGEDAVVKNERYRPSRYFMNTTLLPMSDPNNQYLLWKYILNQEMSSLVKHYHN